MNIPIVFFAFCAVSTARMCRCIEETISGSWLIIDTNSTTYSYVNKSLCPREDYICNDAFLDPVPEVTKLASGFFLFIILLNLDGLAIYRLMVNIRNVVCNFSAFNLMAFLAWIFMSTVFLVMTILIFIV